MSSVLEAPTLPLIRRLQAAQRIPVASRAFPSNSFSIGELSNAATELGGTIRVQHQMLCSAHGLQLVYGNFYNHNLAGTGTETDGPNDITVAASIESGGKSFPVTFNGARQVVIKPGAIGVSDPLGVAFAKAATFYTRTYVLVTAGQQFPRGCALTVAGNFEGQNYANPAGTDLTPVTAAAWAAFNSTRGYSPYAIIGRASYPTNSPVFGLVGDSIISGAGDTDTDNGFALRALNGDYPYLRVSYPGETVDAFMQQGGITRFRRASLLELANVTHIFDEFGINSLASPSIKQNSVTKWQFLALLAKVYATTLTPKTTSTDSFVSLANQTVTANEATRTGYNDWLRDGAPIQNSAPVAIGSSGATVYRAGDALHPLAGWYEIADTVESSRNSGKWRVDGGAWTADGTHPTAAGHAAMAAVIDPSVFGPVTS